MPFDDVRTRATLASDSVFISGDISCLFVLHIAQCIACLYVNFGISIVTTYGVSVMILIVNGL
jgi:hypothetical protein